MSSSSVMDACKEKLLRLRQYVPFMQRVMGQLALKDPGECQKMKSLIDVISNFGNLNQLQPETLDRCEVVCKKLYTKYGGEDERLRDRGNHSPADPYSRGRSTSDDRTNQHWDRNRTDVPLRVRPEDDETPRSPSPEETNRLSSSFVPKKIPDRRTDSDLRFIQPVRDNHGPNSLADPPHRQHHLRTEPVVIPTMSQQHFRTSAEAFPMEQDRDYRFGPPSRNDSPYFDERRVSYKDNNSTAIAGISRLPQEAGAGPSVNHSRRESRFDRYSADALYSPGLISPRPDERKLVDDPSQRPTQWGSQQPPRDPHRDRMGRAPDRDYSFQRNADGFSNPGDGVRHQQNWNSSGGPNPAFSRATTSRWGPPLSTEPRAPSPHHGPAPSSNMHGSRAMTSTWAPMNSVRPKQDQPPRSYHGSDWESPSSSRNPHYSNNAPSSVGVPPRPFSASHAVPIAAQSSSVSPQTARFPAPQNPPHSAVPSRREDPRLANRPKSSSSASNQPAERTSSSSSASSSRPADTRGKGHTSPIRTGTSSSEGPRSGSVGRQRDTSPALGNPARSSTNSQGKVEENPRKEDKFVSPLDSLYSGSSKSGQTGRGYGVQTYRIPKKKTETKRTAADDSKSAQQQDGPVPASGDAASDQGSSQMHEASGHMGKDKDSEDEEAGSGRLQIVEDADPPPIPMEVLESYLKKALPSDDAEKVLERLKTTTKSGSGSVDKGNSEAGASSKTVPALDATVTSSGDGNLHNSEEEGQAGAQSHATTEKKVRGRPRKDASIPLEVARLREDLTDFMKGAVEPGTRRTRARTAPQQTEPTSSQAEGIAATVKGKRGRKRKISAPTESDLIQNDFSAEAEEGPHPVGEGESLDSSTTTTELNSTSGSATDPDQAAVAGNRKGKKPTRMNQKKGPSRKNPSPDGDPGASKGKKKKTFVPTRLSLRGRRSMYENSEPSEAMIQEDADQSEIPASGDEYFQCKECSFLGQKIVHHYVNEHPGSEIPYIAVPDSEWDAICANDQGEIPSCQQIDPRVDLSWIPTRTNYMTPVLCKLCPYSSSKRNELLEHVLAHALPANCKYRCSLCSRMHTNFFDMYDHVASHTGEYRFKCNYCDFKVASRAGIKQHMNSLHESQDGLFYSTTTLDANQLWVFGYACKTCRFVQMGEDRLNRHLSSSPDCQEYIRISLITVTREEGDVGEEERENGVFLCPALEQACLRPEKAIGVTEEEELSPAITLPPVDLVKSLVEKLADPVSDESSSSPSGQTVDPSPSCPTTSVEKEAEHLTLAKRRRSDSSVDEDAMHICEDAEAVDEGVGVKFVPKPNTWLGTTISKLADMLATDPLAVAETNAEQSLSSSLEEESDGELEMDVEDDDESQSDEESEASKETSDAETADDDAEVTEGHEGKADQFLRIESVISLSDSDAFERDPLDIGSSSSLHSSVVMRKGEVTFPFPIQHNRPEFAVWLKDGQTYKKTLERSRIRNLFKCMAYRCIFTSSSVQAFVQHLHWHHRHFLMPNQSQPIPERRMPSNESDQEVGGSETVSVPDYFLCSYCPFHSDSPEMLGKHVESRHRDCTFQCSACFFRARAPKMVSVHALVAHPTMVAYPLDCERVEPELSSPSEEEEQLTVRDLPRYRCCVTGCSFACIHRATMENHLADSHPGVKEFKCRSCQEDIVCSTSDYASLFLHMNAHGLGFFQCAFCRWGTDLPADMLLHACLTHPSPAGKALLRCSDAIPASVTARTLSRFWAPHLPHAYSGDPKRQIDFDRRFLELFKHVQVIQSDLTPEEDVAAEMDLDEAVVDKPCSNIKEEVIDMILPESDKMDTETEFHGFGEEEQAKAKRLSAECIVIDSDPEEENVLDEPSTHADPEQAEEEAESQQEGLHGRLLYRCGNMGCDESAETAATLKEHLMVCDLARDSRLLTCRHCGKNMKQIPNLMDHLRSHGIKRFSCGLCNYRAFQAALVRKHMKTLHRVSVVDEVSAGTGPGPAHSENTLYALYPREMAARMKARTRMYSRLGGSNIFTFKDVGRIPIKSILPCNIQCAHCGYKSKVRLNMIRHLALHEKRIDAPNGGTSSEGEEIIPRLVIPDQAPVNPVPHLESPTKGKMFDKMANLAYSSHATGKDQDPKGRVVVRVGLGSSASEDSASEDGTSKSSPPIFIPDHKRYVCGFTSCSHMTINDTLLKHHLQTLHKNETFSCQHCQSEDNQMSLEAFRSHLKMHGPLLYKCGHCVFYHWSEQEMELHLLDKHPNRSPWLIPVRKPEDAEIKRQQQNPSLPTPEKAMSALPWRCCLCKQVASTSDEMMAHVESSHGIKNQFKCALCPVRCNIRSEFDRHFSTKHPGQEVQVLSMFVQNDVGETSKASELETTPPSNFRPLWNKREPRLRHIRGILLEESEIKIADPEAPSSASDAKKALVPDDPVYGSFGSPTEDGLFCCPMCNKYKVSYGRDLKIHLYRELNYKKFLCSICNEGEYSRIQAMKHIEKQHPKENGFIREITSNQALEDWIEKVINVQSTASKPIKALTNVNKAKKSSLPSSPIASPAASPSKQQPSKAKKTISHMGSPLTAVAAVSTSSVTISFASDNSSSSSSIVAASTSASTLYPSNAAEADDSVMEHGEDPTMAVVKCQSCNFIAQSNQQLELHASSAHGSERKTSGTVPSGTGAREGNKAASVSGASEAEDKAKPAKKGVTTKAFKCAHCPFRTATENGINQHWQRCHAGAGLALDFECDLPSSLVGQPDSAKIFYKCLHCGITGVYTELKEHTKSLHPNLTTRLHRLTSKSRQPVDQANTGAVKKDSGPPPPKKSRVEAAPQPSTNSVASQPSPASPSKANKGVAMKGPGSGMGSPQPVFVVASPPPGPPPTPNYTCVCCMSRFFKEREVIRHHATHSSRVPLRYTCLEPPKPGSSSDPSPASSAKPELAVMEIRFGCPVCPNKFFVSLAEARNHVSEHKQAWKCGHCAMLFGSPQLALQHWKEAHPGIEGKLESIDTPSQINEKLYNGITLTRVQLNTKSLLNPPNLGEAQPKVAAGNPHENKEKPALTSNPVSSPPPLARMSAVARKSTSANLFLKQENSKNLN